MSHHLSYSRLSAPYQAFLANISSTREPHFYHEAVHDPRWRQDTDLELEALDMHHTWDVVDLPAHIKPIGCR